MTLGTGEAGTKETKDQFHCQLGSDDTSADRDDVHVVVLDALMRREGVVAERAPNSGQLARCDARADAAAADQHTAIGVAADDGTADRCRDVGIIDGIGARGADVTMSPRDRSSVRIGSRNGQPAWSDPKATFIGDPPPKALDVASMGRNGGGSTPPIQGVGPNRCRG